MNRHYVDETGRTTTAKNYHEAACNLYGLSNYPNPQGGGELPTTYVRRHSRYAEVRVYNAGDKQGSFWGVQAATPTTHIIITTNAE